MKKGLRRRYYFGCLVGDVIAGFVLNIHDARVVFPVFGILWFGEWLIETLTGEGK